MASGISAFFSRASQGASPARRIARAAAKASSDDGPRMPSVAANRPASPASLQPNRLKTMTFGPGEVWAMAKVSANWGPVNQCNSPTIWRCASGSAAVAPPTASREMPAKRRKI